MSKGTPMRYIRISDTLWAEVRTQAANEGVNVSELVRGLLRGWLDGYEWQPGNEGEK